MSLAQFDLHSLMLWSGLCGVVYAGWWRTPAFWDSWAHELKHALATVLTGGSVNEFVATAHAGGRIRRTGGIGLVVSLAPYSIPGIALVLLAAQVAIAPACNVTVAALIGFFIGLHWGGLPRAIVHNRHGDIAEYGLPLSLVWIVTWNTLTAVVGWAFVGGGRVGLKALLQSALRLA